MELTERIPGPLRVRLCQQKRKYSKHSCTWHWGSVSSPGFPRSYSPAAWTKLHPHYQPSCKVGVLPLATPDARLFWFWHRLPGSSSHISWVWVTSTEYKGHTCDSHYNWAETKFLLSTSGMWSSVWIEICLCKRPQAHYSGEETANLTHSFWVPCQPIMPSTLVILTAGLSLSSKIQLLYKFQNQEKKLWVKDLTLWHSFLCPKVEIRI